MIDTQLEDLMQESVEHLEKNFYEKKFYYSYSSLNKLLWNPAVFYQMYIMGLKEEKTDAHLVQGKVIHALLLEEDRFDELFIVSPANLPTGNPRMVIDRVFYHHTELARNGDPREKLEDFQDAILDIMKDMSYHQNLKTDQQRLDKILTPDVFSYWAFMKMKNGKTLVDQETHDYCKTAVELVRTNKDICRLIGSEITEFDNKEVFNELFLQHELEDKVFGVKGIIDNVVVDHDSKTIYINDIKTTGKDLKDFPETVNVFSYWLQAAMYVSLGCMSFRELMEKNYEIKFHFVVIDRTFQTYAFPVSHATLNQWLDKFKETLDIASWHYTNKSFELPYQFTTGKMTL